MPCAYDLQNIYMAKKYCITLEVFYIYANMLRIGINKQFIYMISIKKSHMLAQKISSTVKPVLSDHLKIDKTKV